MVNPFNPEARIRVPPSIGAGRIAAFLVNYARSLAAALKGSRRGDRLRLLRDLGVLLLEPVWYASVGEEYVPPADTRVPTHTVFDHASAALTTLLWCLHGGGEPDGHLLVVDLAGVQQWIREARRLRDLWAASWLASLLAWKAVERLVDEYGPGALVQPPARLHPFLAAKLAGLAGDPEVELETVRGSVKVRLSQLLGLPLRWPVDPTVPSRVVAAAPPTVDPGGLQGLAAGGVEEAWRTVLRGALGWLESEAQSACKSDPARCIDAFPTLPGASDVLQSLGELVKAAGGLEPPLMARVHVASVRDAFTEAARKARELGLERLGVNPEAFARGAYFQAALARLTSRVKVKAPGRRLGRAYYEYASKLHSAEWGKERQRQVRLCTVCGRAPAMVDGAGLPPAGLASKLAGEVGGDRLCPYCLAKRLLRRLLEDEGLDERLVYNSLKDKSGALGRLRFDSVVSYTSRTLIASGDVRRLAELLCRNWNDVLAAVSGERGLIAAAYARNTARGLTNPPAGCRDAWEYAVSLALEVVHDAGLLDRLARQLEAHELGGLAREVRDLAGRAMGVRAKYALLAMDADNAGLTVQGRLPLTPREYAELVFNVADSQVYEKAVEAYEALARLVQELAGSPGGGCEPGDECERLKDERRRRPPAAVVTPSYAFSLSRALALSALIDRSVVEDLGGMVIYAGGDDLLAVLPPAAEREEGYDFPALKAAGESRLAYWGSHSSYGHRGAGGFNTLRLEGGVAVGVAPALRAYGKSAAVYAVDSGYPLWAALEELRALEESKDSATRRHARGGPLWPCKDALFVASDAGGAAVLPWTLTAQKALGGGSLLAGQVYRAVGGMAAESLAKGGGRASLSPQAFHEAAASAALALEAAEKGGGRAARLLVERILERHHEDEAGAGSLAAELSNLAPPRLDAYEVVVGSGGRAGELARASLGAPEALLPVMALHAARVVRGWL